jgi:hypothetical protein
MYGAWNTVDETLPILLDAGWCALAQIRTTSSASNSPCGGSASNAVSPIITASDWYPAATETTAQAAVREVREELGIKVCVVTSAYLASRWCAAEVATVRSRGSRLAGPFLKSIQHTDTTQVQGPFGCG